MTTARSIVCGSCGSDVPYGRLSCPSCGDLLASVAGGRRRAWDAGAPGTVSTTAAAASGGERVPPSVLHDASEPTLMASLALDDEPLASASVASGSVSADSASSRAAPDSVAPGGAAIGGRSTAAIEPGPEAERAWDGAIAYETDDGEPSGGASGAAAEAPGLDEAIDTGERQGRHPASPPIVDGGGLPASTSWPPPGAYVPPVANLAGGPGMVTYGVPGGPAAPARSWAGHGAAAAAAADATAGPGASTDGASGNDRVTEFVGWLAIAGGVLAAVGFLLPWGASMIGATGVGYIERWGLAGPFHVIVAVAVVALVVSVIVPNRVPAWVRIGLGGTILGVFLLGLVWPYVFGFSSTGPGALAVGSGAAALTAAGVASLVTDRHARRPPPV